MYTRRNVASYSTSKHHSSPQAMEVYSAGLGTHLHTRKNVSMKREGLELHQPDCTYIHRHFHIPNMHINVLLTRCDVIVLHTHPPMP